MSENLYIPSIEELNIMLKQDLRTRENILEIESNFYDRKSFFERFQKSTKDEKRIEKYENIYYEKYFKFLLDEKTRVDKIIEDIENEIDYNKFFLNYERKLNRKLNRFNGFGSTSNTRYRLEQIKKLQKNKENILNNSYSGWMSYNRKLLLKDIENSYNGNLVNVSYVNEAKERVKESLKMGNPIYIVGHLGSGKTQLATESAIEFNIENKIQKELEDLMEKFYTENLDISEKDAINKFKELNLERKDYYNKLLNGENKSKINNIYPLFISGSYNLTYEDMFVEKTLSFSHSFTQKSFSEYLDAIVNDFYKWIKDHENDLNSMSSEEQLNLKIQIWKSLSDLLVAKNSAFGTEVTKIEKEILIALREGRVIIVDELNTIAMQNLIGLNDILQKHIGSRAYITGIGSVIIEEGFGFIGTGNLSTELINYEGTNELNPAFKSRFITIEYNYLPQNLLGNIKEQYSNSKNQLFRVILSRLCDNRGYLNLPEIEKNIDELFRFAQLSKMTQNVFMGKYEESDDSIAEVFENMELKESVLSIRNIIHILDSWNFGEEKDLSKAIWDGFISSITNPNDQRFLLDQSKRYGFFKTEDGWKNLQKNTGYFTLTYSDIRDQKYEYHRETFETYSYLDILELIFDNKPKLDKLPNRLVEIFKLEYEKLPNINLEKYIDINEKTKRLEHSINLLEYLDLEED